MITLDGWSYFTHKTDYADHPLSPSQSQRGLTGKPLVIESGLYIKEYTITLNLSQPESERLKASFIKCHSTNVNLAFIDEQGITWDPTNGSDTPNHFYSTGVWFDSLSEPKPATESLFDDFTNRPMNPTNRFLTQITLYLTPQPSGHLLTEASQIIATEAGDKLLWQAA